MVTVSLLFAFPRLSQCIEQIFVPLNRSVVLDPIHGINMDTFEAWCDICQFLRFRSINKLTEDSFIAVIS